jgi:hypothetical protein
MVKTVMLCFFGYQAMQRWWGGGELAVGKMRRGPSPYFPRHLTKEGTVLVLILPQTVLQHALPPNRYFATV